MLRVQLQDSVHREGHLRVHPLHVLLHLEAHAGAGHHGDRVVTQVGRQANFLHLVSQALLHEGDKALQLLRLLLDFLLLLLGLQAQILRGCIAERLFCAGLEGLGDELVHLVGKQQHIIALIVQGLNLGELAQPLGALAGDVVNLLLALGHGIHILLQGDKLSLLVAVEHEQILGGFLVDAVLSGHAEFQLAVEHGVELLVGFPVVFQHGSQLGLDLLLHALGNHPQLPVMLQHLPADVQGQVLAVHHAPDEAEVLRQQILAVFHNHHAGRIQLQACLEVLGVEVIGGSAGDIQQSLEGHGTLGAEVDGTQGLGIVKEFLPVEALVLLLGHVLLVPLPQRHHGVQGLHLLIGLVLRLVLGAVLLQAGLAHLHADGVADIVGILLHQAADLILLQELGVLLLLRVCLQGHNYIGAGGVSLGRLYGVAVLPAGLPLPGGILAVLSGNHRDLIRHHKGCIEAHAELADDVHILGLFHALLEAKRAGLTDGAQVLLHLLLRHADAVIGYGEGTVLGVPGDGDGQLLPVHGDLIVGKGGIGQLVHGVGAVGNNLPEENLLVGVDRMNH